MNRVAENSIAVIGLSCRFPGAQDASSFWQMLLDGREAVAPIPAERWQLCASEVDRNWSAGLIQNIENFDPEFFGISLYEAGLMDPQQRLLLEVTWEAIESAGLNREHLAGSATGVFIGISTFDYSRIQRSTAAHSGTGNALSIAANRISYFLDLRGPSLAVDTACSSSLTAIHLAVESLRRGETSLALVGGVNAILCADVMHILQAAGMLAADGRCKTFDSRADGYVRGEGCGVVVLKRLSDAQKAGDRILAVIRGSAANQDGRSNGLTAPNGPAQEALIETALADAGLKPADIDFVEAHGTGTALGDPIEAMALDAVLSRGRLGGKPCLLGSVKTNIGHLEAAAGIAALIKTTLSLQHGRIPRSLHYRAANPRIPFDKMSVRVAEDAMPWPNRGLPSRAGISGFGFGGANVHVILESAPQAAIFTNSPRPAGPTLVAISAPSATALQNRLKRTEAWLADADRGSIEEISYSTTVRQTHFSHRWAAIVADAQSLRDALAPMSNENETPGVRSGVRPLGGPPPLVYVYSGQGAEVAGMGRALHGEFPKFRAMLEACDAEARSAGGQSILRELIEAPMASYSQPSQVAFQISLTALLSTFGLRADAVTGHSLGEISAAWAAGVLSLHDAMRLSVLRDKVMAGRRGSGGMLCIDAPHVDVASLLNGWSERAGIAAINGPSNTVVFATVEAQDELIRTIESVGLVYQRVRSESAFHSPHMDEARIELTRHLIDWQPEEEQIPFFSTRLGRRVSGTQLTAEYWGHQLRDPVQFSTAVMDIAHENPGATFLEIGAHPVLGAALNQCLSTNEMTCRILAAMRRQTAERDSVLRVLGELYVEGRSIRWEALFSAPNPKWVPLPGYTWQHKRCWTGVSKSDGALLPATAAESRSLREMTGRPAEERRQFLEAELRKAVARLLEIADAGQVAVDVEFMQMGLDSLMSAQLRIRAEKLVGRPLPGNFLTTHPTVTAVVDFIESAQAPAEEKTAEGELPAGIPRIERKQAEFPLSSAQERMWFQHLLSPESAVYTEHAVLRIHGDLNAPILRRSLQQMLDGEEALRLSFHERGGVVFQTVAATAELPWEEIDYSQEPPDRREELKRAATLKAAQRVFPLDRAPLFQATLLRVAADEHVLVLAAHHIVIDGWSFQMILDRVFRTHGQLLRGEPDAPALRQIEFCDYAQWEAGRRRAGAFTPAVDFWKRRLEGRAEVTRIRPDFSPTRTATKACAVFRFEVDTENLAGLRALAQREKTTLFTVMVAAFQTLLFSYLQENELAVGVPVSNRIEPEVENMVGMFVNTVALPSSIRAEDSLAAVLDKTKTAVQEALAHREAPFQDVVAALKRSGAADQNPLFEIVFDLQKASGDFLNEQGLRFEYTPIDPRTAKFDLVWSFLQTENALLGRVEYRADLFRPETIARLARHYQAILRALVEDSKVAVGRLPLLDPAEQAAAVAASKGPVHLPEAVATVHGLIEKRAAEQPLAPAVVEGGQCLTYGELNARANAFANALLRRGVQPRDRVAVVLEKSLRQCICLLAVAKCGATYVPLDPALPAKRLAGMLADARPRLVIASGDHSFDELAEIELCLADKLEADAKSEAASNPGFTVRPEDPLYVIYTSGSTGRPKGVVVPHRGLLNLANWYQRAFAVTPADRCSVTANPAFDASAWEFWCNLAGGAALHLTPALVARTPGELIEWIAEQGITISFLPTPMADLVLNAPWPATKLRCLQTGGDVLRRRPHAALPFAVFNNYGPTEGSVAVTSGRVLPATAEERLPDIGKPIDNMEVYLLNGAGELAPDGAVGEIYLGGPGLALGYLNDPELTAARFIELPVGGGEKRRLYRTGDLASRGADGSLEFIGRADNQVKIRGYRIELAEIELVLSTHASVVQAAAFLFRTAAGEMGIGAAVALKTGDQADLREHCRLHLPAPMMPVTVECLAALPLTPNGKLDRRQMAARAELQIDQAENAATSAANTDGVVQRLFAEVLGVPAVAKEANFFDLGGHSLLAVQLGARINAEFGARLSIQEIFNHPTPASLERRIAAREQRGQNQGTSPARLIGLSPEGEGAPVYMVCPASGSPLCYLELTAALALTRPVFGLQAPGLLDDEPPAETVEALAADFRAIISRHNPDMEILLAGWSYGGQVAYELGRLLAAEGRRVKVCLLDIEVLNMASASAATSRLGLVAGGLREAARNLHSLGLPTNYERGRQLARWVGISLPPSLRAFRLERTFLRDLLRTARKSMRLFSINYRAGRNYILQSTGAEVVLFKTNLSDETNSPIVHTLQKKCEHPPEIVPVAGNHMTIFDPENLPDLASALRHALAGGTRVHKKQQG